MQVICTLVLLFTFAIGQMWGSTSYYNLFYGTTKAVDGSNVNSDDFKYFGATINTSATSTTIDGNSYTHFIKLKDYASSIATDSTKVLAYDAKTTHTKVTAYVKNGDSSKRTFYIGRIVEGETTEQTGDGKQVTQDVSGGGTAKIVFELENTKNTLIGLFGGGKANWEIYQVVVEESGTALLKGGETGYELAFPGRIGASGKNTATTTPTMIDGMELRASNSLKYLNGPLKLKQTTSYIKFTLAAAQTVKVTPYNTRKFIFSTTATPSGSETKYGGTGATEVSVELAPGTYYLESESSSELQLSKIAFAAASCTEPTTTFANGEYTVGGSALDLSTLIGNNNSSGAITYEVKNANGTGASISTASFTATTAGTCMVTATQAADGGKCEKVIDATITVSAPSTPTHGISYTNLKGSDVSAYPTTYYEGTGIASFAALADVTDFHFNGWSPSSIPTTAKADPFEVSATWVAAYNVTFSYGAGGGTVPTSFQKWQGAKFNLPGQGSMTAPSGKVFDGWKASGTKYAENAEYTMGNAAVEFVAQWKAVPQTIYSLTVTNTSSVNLNNGGAQNDLADDATIVGGGAYMQNDHASSAQQILGSTKLQFKAGTITLAMTLNTALKEGDTIKATGLNSEGLCFGVTFNRTDNLDNQLASDASYFVVPEEFEGKTTLYAWRHSGSGTTCASIIIRRPADRPISSTAISLSDLKVNNRSISSDSLTMLKTGPAYSLHLGDEFVTAPVIKFNRHKVITFADSEEPTQAIYDRAYSVTATTVSSQWQAAQEINDITYTVTATKITSYTVAYKDENGTTSLGSEVVAVGEHPTASGITAKKAYHSFAGWTLGGNPVELTGVSAEAGVTVTLVASYTPAYATSVNIEQWVLDNSKNNTAFRAVLAERHYTYSNLNDLDSLTTAKNETDRNEPYLGQKWKKNNSEIGFLLKSGSTVRAKFGYVGDNVNIKIGSADAITKTAAQLETPYEYTASEDVIIKLQGTGENTVVVKQIMIDEAIATVKLHAIVTYDAGTGSYGKANEKYTGTPLVIGNATPVTDSIFAGWYLGDDQIDATAYVPTKNVTLQAHYAPQEYAIAYDGNGATSGSMSAGAAGWGTMVTPATNAFEKTGHIFSGWEITKTEDGSATGITFSEGKFEMPKYDVTLVAQWEDNSKVAQIVETNVKYESFAAAIAAVQADQTIQLLQDCEYSTYWNLTIADTVTLDLNGKNLTYTGTLRGVQVSNGGTLVLMDGTATVAPTIDLTTSPMARTAINYTSGVFDSKDGMCALAGSEIVINSGTYLATEGVILVKGENATATVNDGVLICRDNSVVSGNGTNSADFRNYVMNIHGGILYGEIFSAGYASMVVYHPNVGTLNIDGGILVSTNGPCVVTRGGASNITGGTLVAIGDGTGKCGDASLVLPAVGVACDFKSAYPGVASTNVAISGTVDVTGEAGAVKAVYKAAEPTAAEVDAIGVSGGTFNTELTNEVCAPGFVPAPKDPVTGKYSVEPKDGVSIIKAVATNKSQDITGDKLTGIYKGAAHIETATDYKLNEGKYFMVQLEEGKNFQAGDIVKINVSAVNDCNGFTLYSSDEFIAANLIIDTHENSDAKANVSTGINEVELPNTYAGSNKLYVARADGADKYLNAGINQVEVVRVIYPTLTAISFNGVAGAIDEANKTVAVTIPYDADLAALTITKTILWNEAAATGSILINGSATGAWVEGDNTYKLTDKDGDYTVYTITLTRDVQKHAVSFNTHGGTAVASVEVVDGGYLAAAPADPTKEDYIFQYWSETEDGAEVDVTTVQIDEDKTFHAVWASDGAIKLINGDVVNHTNFLTGTNETTVEIESVDYKCVDFTTSGSNRTTVASISDLKEFIQYNATTNKAKISLSLYNTNSSAVSVYLHMLEEGSETPTTEEISVPAGEILKTNYYAFNSEKNRSFYITCGNRNYIKVLQVKVVDDGTTTLKKAGQVGYSVNTLKSRIFAPQQSAISFEGLTVNANAVCKPLSTTALKIKNNYNISFHADVDMTLAVTTEGNQTYYVSATADGTTNETSFTGRKEFEITAGDWYIHAGSSELKVAKLEFIAPKCEKPTVADMADVDLCAGEAFTALAVSASVSDEGTLHYAWFKEAGETDEAVGTDAATYTPEADGQYYVIVTNRKDNFTDNSKTSNTITVEHFAVAVITTAPENVVKEAGEEATLSVVASGKNCTYEWFACDDALGTNPVAFIPAETGTSLTVTVAGEKYYMVVVSSDCGEPVSAVAKVEEWIAYPQADVTGSITWDWTNAAWPTEGTASFKVVDGELDLLANQNSIVPVVDGVNGFRADMLLGSGQYVWRYGGADKKCFQGTELKFHTTVAGTVTVWYRSTSSGTDVKVYINGQDAGHHSTGNYTKSSTIVVPANSDVRITKEGTSYVRINKIVFNADPDYTREVSNNIGTLCVNHNVLAGGFLGATFYQIASRNELYDYKIDFEEVLPNEELKAGEPYIFQSTTGRIDLFFGETVAAEPVPVRGMIGNYGASTLAINEDNQHNILYIAQNKLWTCENLVGQNLILNEHRAYIDMTQVPTYAAYQELLQQQQNSAPGRRRVTLGTNAEQVATGFDALNADEAPVKMMIDGKLFILRGEKMYDATGRLVK